MRRVLILLSFAIILLVVAAHVYRDPRVQELFRSAPTKDAVKRQPGHAVVRRPSAPPIPSKPTIPETTVNGTTQSQEHTRASVRPNQVPNETVSGVLLRVLAAKGLAQGIALQVSDESIKVFGEVDSDAKRRDIIALIEKGRENRRLDVTELTVQR